jgi:hypothetical protein
MWSAHTSVHHFIPVLLYGMGMIDDAEGEDEDGDGEGDGDVRW